MLNHDKTIFITNDFITNDSNTHIAVKEILAFSGPKEIDGGRRYILYIYVACREDYFYTTATSKYEVEKIIKELTYVIRENHNRQR